MCPLRYDLAHHAVIESSFPFGWFFADVAASTSCIPPLAFSAPATFLDGEAEEAGECVGCNALLPSRLR